MHSFNHILLLLSTFHFASTFTFSEVSSLLSNTTQTPLLNPTSSSLSRSEALQCDPPDTVPPLEEDDCYSAFWRVPGQSAHARFHGDGRRGFYKLPWRVWQGKCGITIGFVDHVIEEQSSWDEIHDGVYSLLIDCVDGENGVGGNILVGYNLRIRVAMHYVFDEEVNGRSNNSAILSGRTTSSSTPPNPSEPNCCNPGSHNAPDPIDCRTALNRFPTFTSRHAFHRAGAWDGYRLPILAQHQTCEFSISLVGDVQEEESCWVFVFMAASLLTATCVQDGGGRIFLGERDHIQVTLKRSMLETIGNNNSTMLSNRTSPPPSLRAAEPSCYPPGTGYQLSLHDCLTAQSWMPSSATEGAFHEAGADDGRRLPLIYTHQTCYITVELVDSVQEERSTWMSIGWETWLLIVRCVIQAWHLGGEILIGEGKHIRVTVRNPIREVKGTITAGDVE